MGHEKIFNQSKTFGRWFWGRKWKNVGSDFKLSQEEIITSVLSKLKFEMSLYIDEISIKYGSLCSWTWNVSFWHLQAGADNERFFSVRRFLRECISSESDTNSAQSQIWRSISEVKRPIQGSNIAKPEQNSILRVWILETCSGSSSGRHHSTFWQPWIPSSVTEGRLPIQCCNVSKTERCLMLRL